MNGLESIMDKEKKRMCELENKITKIPQYKQQRKKYTQKNEQSLQDMWNYDQRSNICVTIMNETKGKLWQNDKIFKEITTEIFQNFAKMIQSQIREA